jgi:hypothetical protein
MNSARRDPQDETTVDDVRRIREQFQRESGGDLHKHVEQSNQILEKYRELLDLVVIEPPCRSN